MSSSSIRTFSSNGVIIGNKTPRIIFSPTFSVSVRRLYFF
jgi:hypothetical protein